MNYFPIILFGGLVLIAIGFNVYFRIKVVKLYKQLLKHRIEVKTKHIFSRKQREADLYPRYERYRELIEKYCSSITSSLKVAAGIFVIILLIGFIMNYS